MAPPRHKHGTVHGIRESSAAAWRSGVGRENACRPSSTWRYSLRATEHIRDTNGRQDYPNDPRATARHSYSVLSDSANEHARRGPSHKSTKIPIGPNRETAMAMFIKTLVTAAAAAVLVTGALAQSAGNAGSPPVFFPSRTSLHPSWRWIPRFPGRWPGAPSSSHTGRRTSAFCRCSGRLPARSLHGSGICMSRLTACLGAGRTRGVGPIRSL
jgi:hypothetical protein